MIERDLKEETNFKPKWDVRFVDIDENNAEDLNRYKVGDLDRSQLEGEILKGKTLVLVLDGEVEDTVLAYGFVDYQHIWISGLRIRLDKKMMYQDYAFTMESSRGRGVYPRMLNHMCRRGLSLGYERCLSQVVHFNKSSRRGASKANFRKIGVVRSYLIFKRWKIILHSSSLLKYVQGV